MDRRLVQSFFLLDRFLCWQLRSGYNFNLGNGTTGSDNGNVISITNGLVSSRSENFTYDSLNRISTAYSSGTNWGETYTIDAWGNLTNIAPYTGKTNSEPLGCAPANIKNRLNTCFTYDAAGNLILNSPNTYTYDAENRLIATGGQNYLYDGDGNRVAKCGVSTCAVGTAGTFYWRNVAGDTLIESNTAGTFLNQYVFFNGQRVARRDLSANLVHYYFSDHLGSHSLVTNADGTHCEQDTDYYPYGGQLNEHCTTPVAQNYKFTGKERDAESGLDEFGARYYASSLGRFMIPDWSESPTSVPYASLPYPQSLNLYSYVQNNPLSRTDPNGHCDVDREHHNWVWCAAHAAGFTETKKEYQARMDWAMKHPITPAQSAGLQSENTAVMMIMVGMVGGQEAPLDEELVGAEATAAQAAADVEATAGATGTGTVRTMVNGVPQPAAAGETVVGPNGTAVKIPAGYVAESARNGNGIVYRPAGSTGNANTIRVMGADARQGARVIIYNSSGQPLIPGTQRTGTPAETHTPLN